MTAQEMIEDVWEGSGDMSDLNPYSDAPLNSVFSMTSSGAVKLLRFINRAYRRILLWKQPNGRLVRFTSMEGKRYFTLTPKSGTVVSATSSTITLDSNVDANDDQYNGYVIRIDGGTGEGQVRIITYYTSARVATINREWDINPDSTSEYSVYKSVLCYGK